MANHFKLSFIPRGILFFLFFGVCFLSLGLLTAQEPERMGAPRYKSLFERSFKTENLATIKDSDFWTKHSCQITGLDNYLTIERTGWDPFFGIRVPENLSAPSGVYTLKVFLSKPCSAWELFWGTVSRPNSRPEFSVQSRADATQPRVQVFEWSEQEPLAVLRLDPPDKAGTWQVEKIELLERIDNPVVVAEKKSRDGQAVFILENRSEAQQSAVVAIDPAGQNGKTKTTETFAPGEKKTITVPGSRQSIEEIRLSIETDGGFAPYSATVRLIDAQPNTNSWTALKTTAGVWKFQPNGACAVFSRSVDRPADGSASDGSASDGSSDALIAPLVRNESCILTGKKVDAESNEKTIVFEYANNGAPLKLELSVDGARLNYRLTGVQSPISGPTVFALDPMTNASFPGLEMLEKGERSSSTLDIETPESDRSRPNRNWVTQTSMLICTDSLRISVRWPDAAIQPEFAVPDFIDSTGFGGRMGLSVIEPARLADGKKPFEAQIVVDSLDFVEAVADDVRALYGNLPDVPKSPRPDDEQMAFCLDTFVNRMQDDNGWGHCIEKSWHHAFFADLASCVWRANNGQVPFPGKEFSVGGGHIDNASIFFAANQAQRYLNHLESQAASLRAQVKKDPSFPYYGKYDRGHWEHTALGTCARPAFLLNQKAYLTADGASRDAATQVLEYMERFTVPRGGQVWEMPLHTPDPLAGAYAIMAYVRGYELTGNKDFLRQARKWAITGLPFVYLRAIERSDGKPSELGGCLYATIGVYGSTNWKVPLWIGRPVQWIGTVYAYALTSLAPYDNTFDWNKLARGILVSAQYQQYPDGEFAGSLPDSVEPSDEPRHPWNINPSALMILQWRLAGVEPNVTAISNPRFRVACPFAMRFRDEQTVEFLSPDWMTGKPFQVFVNGKVRDAVGGQALKLN